MICPVVLHLAWNLRRTRKRRPRVSLVFGHHVSSLSLR